jgi:hypothetical protein
VQQSNTDVGVARSSNIDANYGDRIVCCCCRHGVLLVWAPLASLPLAGQQHGRTIPLTDVATKSGEGRFGFIISQ